MLRKVHAMEDVPAVGPDGTALDELFDWDARRVAGRVFSDPDIHRLELDRIFTTSWCFVGLASEIPDPGDYVVRPLGGDSVIVARDDSGEVNVMLNACAHRGVQLCVVDRGSTQNFKCPYHGWIFDSQGKLRAMPAERLRLRAGEKKGIFNLKTARVGIYRGFIFATWSCEAPPLDEYLGAARWYLDMIFGAADDDFVALGPPQRWTIPCDWKYGAENFAGDGYHAPAAHASMVDLKMLSAASLRGLYEGVQVCDPTFGHSVLHFNLPKMVGVDDLTGDALLEVAYPWLPPEVRPQVSKHLRPDQWAVLNNGDLPGIGTLFPNFSWLMQPLPGGMLTSVRIWVPAGPGRMELWSWVITHPQAGDALRRNIAQSYAQTFGAGGLLEQDDATIWSRMQRTRDGSVGGRQWVNYTVSREPDGSNYLKGGEAFPGPGIVWQGHIPDDALWRFYLRWYELMSNRK